MKMMMTLTGCALDAKTTIKSMSNHVFNSCMYIAILWLAPSNIGFYFNNEQNNYYNSIAVCRLN